MRTVAGPDPTARVDSRGGPVLAFVAVIVAFGIVVAPTRRVGLFSVAAWLGIWSKRKMNLVGSRRRLRRSRTWPVLRPMMLRPMNVCGFRHFEVLEVFHLRIEG